MIRRILCLLNAILLTVVMAALPGRAFADDHKEYLVKAAFIYNFVKFVEWPDGKATSKQTNIDICVLGDSPMGSTTDVFKAASTQKLALTLVKENNLRDIAGHCHIVYISASEEGKLDDILSSLKGKPVLTVSDINNFAERGGMIGFVMNDNKIKIAVNTKSVTSAGMRVDAQLLEIALRVIDK